MKILITGSSGQLGYDLKKEFAKNELILFDLPDHDISKKIITNDIIEQKPDLIIHAAAYTNVDGAEDDRKNVFLVNKIGTHNVALAAANLQIPLVYISTDYVFDGRKNNPYVETDMPNPLNIYGESKWAGEEEVIKITPKHYIVRTSWLCGEYGKNFVKTMLELAKKAPEIKLVSDQFSSPTMAFDLAKAIGQLVKTEKYGIYHISGEGKASWYDFAQKVFELAKIKIKIIPIKKIEYIRPANLPNNSYLSKDKINSTIKFQMPAWQKSLKQLLQYMR